MPTIYRERGYRFFFYINDHFPPHIHIEKGDSTAKFNLIPLELIRSRGFNSGELKEMRLIIFEKVDFFITKWNEHFSNK